MGAGSFKDCISLTSVEIPFGLTSLECYVFDGCTNLISVVIPNSITTIHSRAFWKCSSLASVEIPNSVTTIDDQAFGFCSSLVTLIIGKNVSDMFSQVFCHSSKLTHVYCYAENVPKAGSEGFYQSNIANATLHVPEASIGSYRNTEPWRSFGKIEPLGEGTGLNGIQSDGIRVQAIGGLLTIEGAVEGTPVIVYDTTGRLLASAMTTRQAARIATSLRKGAVAIVKVGDRVEKVVMK
jgi:hypothetical protein